MRTVVILLLSLTAASVADDRKPEKKRLESVTWDLKTHKLVWVVQKGIEKDGQFVTTSSDRYEITPEKAVMAFGDEQRGFTQDEAASLHKLLDTLSLYCAESVVWWDQGQGEKLGDKPGQDKEKEKSEKIDHQHRRPPTRPAPARKGAMVAAAIPYAPE